MDEINQEDAKIDYAHLPAAFGTAVHSAKGAIAFRVRKDLLDEHGECQFEDFEPVTLLHSLLEAGIPLDHVFSLWSSIIQELITFNGVKDVTESALHGLVTTLIAKFPSPHASEWFTNYHNIYSGTAGFDDEPLKEGLSNSTKAKDLIHIRSATVAREQIDKFLANEFCCDKEDIEKLLPLNELRLMTNHLISAVRQLGLFNASADTVSGLIGDLARNSQKQFIPTRPRDLIDYRRLFDVSERSFQAATFLSESSEIRSRGELGIALEFLARAFLAACNIPALVASRSSIHHLAHLISHTLNHYYLNQPLPKFFPVEALQRAKFRLTMSAGSPKEYLKTLNGNILSLSSLVELPNREFGKGLRGKGNAFSWLLTQARDMCNDADGTRSLLYALFTEAAQNRNVAVCRFLEIWAQDNLGVPCRIEVTGMKSAIWIENLISMRIHANWLAFGNRFLIVPMLESDAPLDDPNVIDQITRRVLVAGDAIGIMVVVEPPSVRVRACIQEFVANSSRILIWLDRRMCARIFGDRESMSVGLDDVISKAMQVCHTTYARQALSPDDYDLVPSVFDGYLRETIAGLFSIEKRHKWSELRSELLSFSEELGATYRFGFHKYLGQSKLQDWPDIRRIQGTLEYHLEENELGHTVDYFRLLHQAASKQRDRLGELFGKLEASFDSIRTARNRIAHGQPNPREVHEAFQAIVAASEQIQRVASHPDIYCAAPFGESVKLFPAFFSGDPLPIDVKLRPGAVVDRWKVSSLSLTPLIVPRRGRRGDGGRAYVDVVLERSEKKRNAVEANSQISSLLLQAIDFCTRDASDARIKNRGKPSITSGVNLLKGLAVVTSSQVNSASIVERFQGLVVDQMSANDAVSMILDWEIRKNDLQPSMGLGRSKNWILVKDLGSGTPVAIAVAIYADEMDACLRIVQEGLVEAEDAEASIFAVFVFSLAISSDQHLQSISSLIKGKSGDQRFVFSAGQTAELLVRSLATAAHGLEVAKLPKCSGQVVYCEAVKSCFENPTDVDGPNTKIFVCYSRSDDRYLQELKVHLTPIARDNDFDVWDDSRILSGDVWRTEIQKAIDEADAAVLLVSPAFIASSFITEVELPSLLVAAKMRGLTVFWIPVKSSSYRHTEIEKLQAAHPPAQPLESLKVAGRNKAWVNICEKVSAALRSKLD